MDIKKLNEAIAKASKEELKPIKAIKPTKEQQEFLDYIKEQIKNEVGISYGEYADLEDLQPQIVYLGDIELAQYAGIDEEVWNISTSMPEHLKPVRTDKTALKEVRGRSYKVLEIKLVKANKNIDVSSILKAIEALEYAENLHVLNYSLSDIVIRVEVFTFSDANIDENRLISDLSKVVNVEGVTIKPTRVDNETVKESLTPTKTNKNVIKEDSGDTVYLFLGKDNSDIVVYSPESLIKYANNQCDYEINDEVDAFNFFKNNGYDIIETTIE